MTVLLLSHYVLSDSVWPHGLQQVRLLCLPPSPSLFKLMSIESVMPSNQLILCHPLLLPPSFPESGSLQMNQLFPSGGQSFGASASASVIPMNTQDWFLLGFTGLISMQSKGLSRVQLSNTTVQKHQFFGMQPSLQTISHICTWLLEKP